MTSKTRETVGFLVSGGGCIALTFALRFYIAGMYSLGTVSMIVTVFLFAKGRRISKQAEEEQAQESADRYQRDLARFEAKVAREKEEREKKAREKKASDSQDQP